MSTELMNDPKYADFVNWLRAILNEESLYTLMVRGDSVLCCWLNDIHEDGYIEVSGQYTYTGNPITAEFPELAP